MYMRPFKRWAYKWIQHQPRREREEKKRERSKTIMKIASVGKALTGDKSKMMVL